MPVVPNKKVDSDAEYVRKQLEIYRELTNSIPPTCKIPWIPSTAPESTVPFEKSKLYKSIQNEYNMEFSMIMRLVDELSPFYHPKRYYNIDCLALHELSNKIQMWSNFKHHLILQRWQEIRLFDDIEEMFTSYIFNDHTEYYAKMVKLREERKDLKQYLFKGITQVEMCESAYEFLFEPWVLIHLPFKPVLLHQWVVGALAEILRFEKDVSEFFHLAVPAPLQEVARSLAMILIKLHESVLAAFLYLDFCVIEDTSRVNEKYIIEALEHLLPPLQFVCSTEGKEMVKALRRKIASENRIGEHVKVKKISDFPKMKNVYCLDFWLSNQKPIKLFTRTRFVLLDLEVKPVWMHRSPSEVSVEEFIDCVVKLAPPETVITKEMKNLLRLGFKSNQKFRLAIMKYKFYSKVMADSTGLGVISNVLTLEAELGATDAMYELFEMLQHIVDLRPDNKNLSGPDFKLDQMIEALSKANGNSGSNKWFPNLFEELSNEVSAELLKVGHPVILTIDLDINEIALSLQARIKFVVLKMARRYYTERMRQRCEFYWMEDSNLAHYLLPCLLVALLEVLQDSKVKEENKKWCLQFVDKLVKTFETHEIEVSTGSLIHVNYLHYLYYTGVPHTSVFTKICKRVVAAIPAELISDGCALQQFRLCLEFFTTLKSMNYMIQMEIYRFYNRLQFVLDSLLPDTTAVDAENELIICCVMAGCAYKSVGYKEDIKNTPDLTTLATAVFAICSKFENVSWHKIKKLKPEAMSDLVSEFKKEAADLSQQQLLAILMHMFVNYNRREKQIETRCHKPDPFETVYTVFHSYLVGDKWRLSQHLGHRMERVQHQVALQQAPVCYSLAIHEVSKKGKLKMAAPGEITFSPLQHCRWCGKVDVADFAVCKMCREDQSYKDANLFCSSECETEALRVQHAEEHARHLMVLCGIPT